MNYWLTKSKQGQEDKTVKAADIMTRHIVTIDSLATIAEAAKVMKQNNVRALIVDSRFR